MPDVQASQDTRNVRIDKVGVKDIRHPLTLKTREGGTRTTVADINMYVALPHHQKGTHMSRFMEILAGHDEDDALHPEEVISLARDVKERLNAEEAHLEINFTYFTKKAAPVTNATGLIDHQATFFVSSTPAGDTVELAVKVAAASLCPCSKEISDYGAHNQRCLVSARVAFEGTLWIEDLIEMCDASASCPVYPILKRADEKFVTEAAYDNPKFVEDSIRDLAVILNNDDRILRYHIMSENFESIHNHNAYAEITCDKSQRPN
jgi:GTP cyclohydrolase I